MIVEVIHKIEPTIPFTSKIRTSSWVKILPNFFSMSFLCVRCELMQELHSLALGTIAALIDSMYDDIKAVIVSTTL